MNVFFTQLRRRAVLFGLLAVLLAAVVALQAISVAALRTVRQQISAVSGRYTTIAVPREGTYWESLLHENDQPDDVSLLRQKTVYPGLIGEDRRAFLKAHVTDCMSISAYEKDVFSIDSYDAFSCAFAVLAVRCTSVTELDSPATRKIPAGNSGDYRTEEYMQRDFYASFSLEDVVCEFPAYAEVLPQIKIILGNGPYPADGNVPFEEGKTYLLFGSLFPSNKELSGFDENGNVLFDFSNPEYAYLYYTLITANQGDPDTIARGEFFNFTHSWSLTEVDDGVYAYCLSADSLPYAAEYTGDVDDFLNSDDGALWRDTILPYCRLNYESANVILTDNLESILWFNTGDASILDGRSLEPTDYANGENVCLVSAAHALKNGLSVGDSIELDFYRSEVFSTGEMSGGINPHAALCNIYAPCDASNRLNIKKEYRIVGIYSAPEFATGEHAFSANTIFAPKASVPNAERYEDISSPLLYSLILENGEVPAFREAIAALGCPDAFAYYDQDYNALAETLDVMHGNAVRMVLLSGALFALVVALFLFLFLRQTADPAKKLRLLGVRAGVVRCERYGAAVLLIVPAAVLGALAAAGLYGIVTSRVLSGNITMQPAALLLAVAAQATILLLIALICIQATARQNLMQKK